MKKHYDDDTALAVVSSEWLSVQTTQGLTPQQREEHDALVAAELYRIRTAYPTQARNFTEQEVEATNALWSEIFAGLPPQLLHEAVMRFIVSDRKAFFPSPGQIVGTVELIIEERDDAEFNRSMIEKSLHGYWEMEMNSIGYNCGNCKWCEVRKDEPSYHDSDYNKWHQAVLWGDEERAASYMKEVLTCTNPNGGYTNINRSKFRNCFEAVEGINLPPPPPEPQCNPPQFISAERKQRGW